MKCKRGCVKSCCAIFLWANFITKVRRKGLREEAVGREVLNSSVRIVDKIYEAGGYGLSGPWYLR